MNRFYTFLVAFATGYVIPLFLVALVSPKLAWGNLKSLGTGIRRDWRVRVLLFCQVVLTGLLVFVHPLLAGGTSMAIACIILFGLKGKRGKIEIVPSSKVVEEVLKNFRDLFSSKEETPDGV